MCTSSPLDLYWVRPCLDVLVTETGSDHLGQIICWMNLYGMLLCKFLTVGCQPRCAILCGIRAADLHLTVLTFLRLMGPNICLQLFANCNNSLISICQYVLFPRVFIYPLSLKKKQSSVVALLPITSISTEAMYPRYLLLSPCIYGLPFVFHEPDTSFQKEKNSLFLLSFFFLWQKVFKWGQLSIVAAKHMPSSPVGTVQEICDMVWLSIILHIS